MHGQEHGVIGDLLHVVGEPAKVQPRVDEQAHDDDEEPERGRLDHDDSPSGTCRVCLDRDEDGGLRDDDDDSAVASVAMSPLPLVVVLRSDRWIGQTDEHEEEKEHQRNRYSKTVEEDDWSFERAQEENSEADVPQEGADAATGVDTAVAVDLGGVLADKQRPRERHGGHASEEHVDEVLVAGQRCGDDVGPDGGGGAFVGEEAGTHDVDAAEDAHDEEVDQEDDDEEPTVDGEETKADLVVGVGVEWLG